MEVLETREVRSKKKKQEVVDTSKDIVVVLRFFLSKWSSKSREDVQGSLLAVSLSDVGKEAGGRSDKVLTGGGDSNAG